MFLTTNPQQEQLLCNFHPCVEQLFHYQCGEESHLHIKMHLDFGDNQTSSSFEIPVSKLESIDWLSKDIRCRFNPDVSKALVKRSFADNIRKQLPDIPSIDICQRERLGVEKIGGEVVFCAGDKVIRASSDSTFSPQIESLVKDFRLDVDPRLSEDEAIYEMFDLIALSPNPMRVILSQVLVYLMRQAYVDAGKEPRVCLFLYGRTGTQKTTIASFLTQIYNRSSGIISPQRLNASIPAAVKIILDACDEVIVLDDLFPADHHSVRSQQEETLIEVTRYIGDGTVPARIKGKEVTKKTPRCGVLFTGEYLIGTGSDAARLFPVEMQQPDGTKLQYFQDRPLVISTFYYFYISWFISHYDEITRFLKEWLDYYRTFDLGVHSRLQETHFFLNTAFILLLTYCQERHVLSKEDATRLEKAFSKLLLTLVRQQDQRVKQNTQKGEDHPDYIARIRLLYQRNIFQIASRVDDFQQHQHDGIFYRKRLYLRRECLKRYFPNENIDHIVEQLADQGVLETGKESRTKQISRLKGLRFYVLRMDYL